MLTVGNLSFRYPNNQEDTLKGISFSIQKGKIFGFLGPSGSGKSTTQKIVYKLLKGYTGTIIFEDKPLPDWGLEFYKKIGVCFELPNHYTKLTARENLNFFSSFYPIKRKNSDYWLDRVGLIADADKLVSGFSKGMKVRLNFVRAILHDPEVLFLDEPTTGLDPINAGKVKQIIKEMRDSGKTIFLTTHNMFDADQLCDEVALLCNGKIQALDSPSKLKLQHGEKKVIVTQSGDPGNPLTFPLDQLGEIQQFQSILKSNTIETIHSKEATLEEVFIKLTGQQLS